MKDRKIFMWVNVFTFLFTLVLNFLATNLPLNDLTTGEISDMFDIYFVPAGYVFAIWGLIYLGLLGFVIYQALPKNRDNQRLAKMDFWFSLSNVANALWLVSFHFLQFGLAMVLMLVLLCSLIMIFLKLDIGREKVKGIARWLVDIPFSIYLGWITVATIANATQLLDVIEWNGFGIEPEIW
ncbi:MAG: tryptophan-rich sensory protein, partial [Chloroflexi bacterium]|nr:tryptophan-rich sensory protein [Chloroflexota bacterium]